MKVAISNIAWPPEDLASTLGIIRGAGCDAIEVAPSRIWPEPLASGRGARREYRKSVEGEGLAIVSLQSLLYNRPDLTIFGEEGVRQKSIEYMKGLCGLASDLGATKLVYGSPRSRRRGDIPLKEAFERAAAFFTEVAPAAETSGCSFVIEPLSPSQCDFIHTAAEGLRLVRLVGRPGLRLHLDSQALSEEPGGGVGPLREVLPSLAHFHVNDPGLEEVGSKAGYHNAFGEALRRAGYAGFVSIEMKTWPDHRRVIERSLLAARRAYLGDHP